MGEPLPQNFSRRYDFTAWPVESESELADYADWLIDIVRHAGESEPEVVFSVDIAGRGDEEMPLDEFRERFDEFPLDKIFSATLTTWDPHQTVGVGFEMKKTFGGGSGAAVEVSGTDKEHVLKVKTKVREEGDARMDARKQRLLDAKAKADADEDFKRQEAAVGIGDAAGEIFRAERQRERERSQRKRTSKAAPPIQAGAPVPAKEPRKGLWQAFKDSDNQAQIIGSGIFGLVIAIVVAVMFGS